MLRSRGFNVLAGASSKLHDHGHILSPTKLHLDSDTLPPSQCPPFASRSVPSPPALGARVTVTSPSSSDANTNFRVPVTGIGLSAIQPSTPELDFGSESLNGPGSAPQSVSFTNLSNAPVSKSCLP